MTSMVQIVDAQMTYAKDWRIPVAQTITVVASLEWYRWIRARNHCSHRSKIWATTNPSGAMHLSLPSLLTCWYYFCYVIPCRYIIRKLARRMDYQCIIVYTVITILPPRYEIEDVSSRNGCFGCIKKAIKRLVGTVRLRKKCPRAAGTGISSPQEHLIRNSSGCLSAIGVWSNIMRY